MIAGDIKSRLFCAYTTASMSRNVCTMETLQSQTQDSLGSKLRVLNSIP